MKKILLLTIALFSFVTLKAQDKVYFTNGDQLEVKVLEVNADNVKYKKYSNIEGPTYTKNKSEIIKVIYQNGESEIFKGDVNNNIYLEKNYNQESKSSKEEKQFRKNRIYIQIASFSTDGIVLIPNIAYERLNSKSKWGQEFSIDYRAFTTTLYDISILRLGIAGNYYLKGKGKGFYVGPATSLAFIDYSDSNNKVSFTALDLGGQIGGQFQISDSFGINIRGKLGYLLPLAAGTEGAFYFDSLFGINFSF